MIALGRYKSCVRSTLLLCEGYECCEKDGMFTAAFPSPRAALQWALLKYATLQIMQCQSYCFLLHCNDSVAWPCLHSVLRNDRFANRAFLDFVNLDHLVPSQSSITHCEDLFPLALLYAQPAAFVSGFVPVCKALYYALH